MRIPASELKAFTDGPAKLPPPVEPALTLAEEIVLLSPEAPRRVLRHVVRIVARAHPDGPHNHADAVRRLKQRGMLATELAQLSARTERVRATIRRAAPPTGRDAELLMLLAATGSLPIEGRSDHLHARSRLAAIGAGAEQPAVAALAEELGMEPADLAERLLPASRDITSGSELTSSPPLWA